jgi:peptidoglycan/LPS O-acetylase OafA/YrhL
MLLAADAKASSMTSPAGWPRRVSEAVPRRFTAGDALRGIAAMLVLVFHAGRETMVWQVGSAGNEGPALVRPIFGPFAAEFVNMRAGIYIFFALSGYLLTRAYLSAFTLGTPTPSTRRYLRNRLLRIVPAFWVIATVYLIWARLNPGGGIAGVLAVYGFAQNYYFTRAAVLVGQAWTLDLEVAFYILIPIASAIALYASRHGLPRIPPLRLAIVLAVLAAAYVASLLHTASFPPSLQYNIADYLFAFIPGVAIAAIEPFAAPRLRGTRRGQAWAVGLAVACVALLAVYVSLSVTDYGPRLALVTIASGVLLAAPLTLQWTNGGCWRVFDNKAMRWLGERSYGIYLIHLGLMIHVLPRIGHGRGPKLTFVLLLAITTAITLIAADLLWRFVEQPALQRRLPWRQAEFARAATTQA